MTANIRAINCTSCGAGQNVLGGGRVQTHVCPYCGAALDAQDGFAVVAKYADMKRPETPLEMGATGKIDGVEFTVIGIAGWEERYGGRTWVWVDHQIFSPTHGYAWLTYEDTGHITFTRRLREQPNYWITENDVEMADSRPSVWVGSKRYDYYDSSKGKITFLEGAFNWTPKMGSSTSTVSLIGDDGMLGLSTSRKEREIERTRLLTAEECAEFGITDPFDPQYHPLGVPKLWANGPFFKKVSMIFVALTILALLVTMFTPRQDVAKTGQVLLSALPIEVPFEIKKGTNLIDVEVRSDVNNGWAYFELELLDGDGEPVALGGSEVSVYSGRDADGYWSEGSEYATFTFRAETNVQYRLGVELSEFGSGEAGTSRTNNWVAVEVKGGNYSGSPLMLALFLFILVTIGVFAFDYSRSRARFRGSDWSSD